MEYFTVSIISIIIIAVIIFLAIVADRSRKKRIAEQRKDFAKKTAQRHVDIIEESKNIINKSKKLDTIVRRFDVILEQADKLKALSDQYQYPDITHPPPEEIENFYLGERDRFIGEFILEEVDNNIQKANAVTRKSTKISLLDKSIIFICDGKNIIKAEDKIKELSDKENELRTLIDKINKEG